MRTVIAIAIGGAIGALARHGITTVVGKRGIFDFPWGTLVVNISGAFLAGVLFVLLTERFQPSEWLRSGLTIGFLGAYTTFSTLALESVHLARGGELFWSVLNAMGSIIIGVVAVVAGLLAARSLT